MLSYSLSLDNNCNFFNVYQLNYQCGHSMLCTAMTVELCFLFSLKMEQAVAMRYATTALSVLGDCQMSALGYAPFECLQAQTSEISSSYGGD